MPYWGSMHNTIILTKLLLLAAKEKYSIKFLIFLVQPNNRVKCKTFIFHPFCWGSPAARSDRKSPLQKVCTSLPLT
jgi:hypothetical protein